MNKILKLILCGIGGIVGLFIIGFAKIFNNIYLINSVWWQIDNQFILIVFGIIFIAISFKFAFEKEGEQ